MSFPAIPDLTSWQTIPSILRTSLVPEVLLLRGVSLAILALALSVPGCGTFRSYDKEMGNAMGQASDGSVDSAIKVLESNNKGKNKDLLYYLELGELQRLKVRYQDSQKSWMAANEHVQAWEKTAQAEPAKLLSGTTAFVINDKVRPYEGHDYEKVMLLTNIALNYLAMGQYENARVAIKQMHELEAVIAELRSQETAKVEQDAQKGGARTNFKELNGYPVLSIDNPEVNALKNSYQSALSHYLAGFVYESLGEPSLAAAGYRFANELQPNQPLLEEALAGLDQRASAQADGLTDVLFVIGSGAAPAIQSRQFSFSIPVNRALVVIPISFPVMAATTTPFLPGQLSTDSGQSLAIAPITSIDLMARRALKDDMPGIMLRATIRSTAKAATQYQLQHQNRNKDNALTGLAEIALAIGAVVTESADERTWRSLPSSIAIARGRLPPGTHTITLQTPEGARSVQLNVAGRYAVVGLRLLRRQLLVQPPEGTAPEGGG